MRQSTATNPILLLISAAYVLSLGGACSELKARREIQRGDKLYEEGRYDEAIELYESALSRAPDLTTGHHNAAVASYRAFQPGVETEENLRYAEMAAEHFVAYLDTHPDDDEIVSLLTNVWLDSERYDDALKYWMAQLEEHPDDSEVLMRLGTINRQAMRYDEALRWDYRRAETAPDKAHKVKAYSDIAQLQYGRLTKSDLVDDKRIAIADSGIAALQKALELAPEEPNLHSLLGSLYQFRSLSHYSTWGRLAEVASQRYYQVRRNERIGLFRARSAAPNQPPDQGNRRQREEPERP